MTASRCLEPRLNNINMQNADLCIDTLDLFQRRRAGHMSKWLYSSPHFKGDKACGADVRQRVIEEAKNGSAYYVFRDEESIIRHSARELGVLLDRPARLIDLGPGSLDAVEQKVFPLIDANRKSVTEYVGVDVCEETLQQAADAVSRKFPDIGAKQIVANFIDDNFTYGEPIPFEMAVLFGLTSFNLEIDPHTTGLSEKVLQTYLKRLRNHFSGDQSYLVMTQDINHDPESLRAAYFAISPYFLCLPHLMRRDLFIEGNFNPDGFIVDIDYIPETSALSTCFIAREDMTFRIESETCTIHKGDRFYFNNAYKFDIPTFLKAASGAGLECLKTIREDGNHCVLHIMKTI